MEKYRVHEVAKDFGVPTKTVTEILTKYVAAPKNHMQVLTEQELSIIFDYLTQHNQVSGIQVIYADVEQPKAAEPVALKAAPQQQSAPKAAPAKAAEPEDDIDAPVAAATKAAAKPADISDIDEIFSIFKR